MKNKISIYLNMIIICLSLCVISIGVYSLTSANLTISGSLGYVYHDKSPYTITATIQNHTTASGGSIGSVANLSILDPTDVTTDNLWQKTKITLPDTMSTIYFQGTGYDVGNNIEVLVTVKNNEDTQKAVVLLFDDVTGLGYTRKVASGKVTTPTSITENHSEAIILSKGEQTTFRLTLKQSIKKTNLSIAKSDFNIQVSVADYDESNFTASQTDTTTTTDITYTLNTDLKSWSVTKSSVSGDVTFEPIVQGLPVNTINGLRIKSVNSGYTLTIPNSVTDIASFIIEDYACNCDLPGSLINLCDYAFSESLAVGITSLLGNHIFNIEQIGKNSFVKSKFTEIELQSDKLESISFGAFRDSSIQSITLPNNLKTIGDRAFMSCKSIQNISIPANVTSIGSVAFQNCSSLTTITFQGTIPPTFSTYVFDICSALTAIYVPSASVEAYKTALLSLTITYDGSDYVSELVTAIPNS